MTEPRSLAVHEACSERLSARAGSFRVTDTTYLSALDSPWHRHDRNTLSVTLTGANDEVHRGRSFTGRPATVFVKPAGVEHRNRIAPEGTRMVVVESATGGADLPRVAAESLERIAVVRDSEITGLAWRLCREIRRADELSRLAIEGLVLEMVACVARLDDEESKARPIWIERARELVHDRFREKIRLVDVAGELGVDPTRLSRGFRRHFHASMGHYVRELRLDWAADRLRAGEEPISVIAARAGFSDQSHLTRAFRRSRGVTPAVYRARRVPGDSGP